MAPDEPTKKAPPETSGYFCLRSHLIPRTGAGWVAVLAFIALFALTQPPVVNGLANRVEPWILGLPFLYVYLLGLYILLIGVLNWARRKDI